MVARINTGKNVSKALNYNEKKVEKGAAELLSASGFIKESKDMNFYEKLERFQQLTSLNQRTSTNTLHVSLNFHPSEKLNNEKMIEIADAYITKIGFGNQPYLVYRHNDAGHPHIHIVSVNIQRDGSRISMHKIGERQSEKARKEIENEFQLIKASDHSLKEEKKVVPVDVAKALYGKSETRRIIANIVSSVIRQYKFSSLHELNAVLRQYNIKADPGKEGSRIANNKGLTFSHLDEKGNKIGVPIKASTLPGKPTLANLEKVFVINKTIKARYKKRLQTFIAWALNKSPADLKSFITELEKNNITVVLHQGKGGVLFGITYIDNYQKCVFNGSDLGKEFSAKAVLEKCRVQSIINIPEHKIKIRQDRKSGPPFVDRIQLKKTEEFIFQIEKMKPGFSLNLPEVSYKLGSAPDFPSQLPINKRKKKKRKVI